MLRKLIFLLAVAVQVFTACTSEVFTVLAGYPVTYSSRFNAQNSQIFRLDVRNNAWGAAVLDKQQWVQVSAMAPEFWAGIVTQGRGDADQWVEEYMVSYTMDGREWTFVERGRRFEGNYDRNTWVRNDFKEPVYARSIRIHPTKWFGHISMRFDAVFKRI